MTEKGSAILRISLALVFLWFGFNQLASPSDWTGFVPQTVANIFFNVFGISATTLVLANSFVELVLGSFLVLGLYTRFSSLILAIHLFGITASLGLSAVGVRDFGLAFATLAIFFNGADKFCLDKKI